MAFIILIIVLIFFVNKLFTIQETSQIILAKIFFGFLRNLDNEVLQIIFSIAEATILNFELSSLENLFNFKWLVSK